MSDSPADQVVDDVTEAEELPVLALPRDGVPPVVDTPEALRATCEALGRGTGPIAVDAERAQSFRYSAKSYLFQLRRTGSGTHIIDPVAFEDAPEVWGEFVEAMRGPEWVIHAASQDLPCLATAGLLPTQVFDTELAGRLLGLPKVGLGALIERYFGQRLLKEHSAADWSRRPLPEDWLVYAALDVELLIELRELQVAELTEAGKLEWALQEFAHLAAHAGDPAPDRSERWRRTNGLHQVRTPLGMALVRELWDERDLLAERYDLSPSKVLIDRAITELAAGVKGSGAQATLPTRATLRTIDGFKRRNARRFENNWVGAIDRVGQLPRHELPPVRVPHEGPPQPRSWEHREPETWARWNAVRPATQDLAEQLKLPTENLISPDTVRRVVWQPPAEVTVESVDALLAQHDARPWQRELVAPVITEALLRAAAPPGGRRRRRDRLRAG